MDQTLLPKDTQQRLQYAIRFQYLDRVSNFVDNMVMGDEVHFHLNGFINKQNCRCEDTKNPNNPQDALFGVLQWLKISISLKMRKVNQKELTGPCIAQCLNIYAQRPKYNEEVWFQRDGTTVHTFKATMVILREIFSERLLSKTFFFLVCIHLIWRRWAFLWCYLKERVYVNEPRTI